MSQRALFFLSLLGFVAAPLFADATAQITVATYSQPGVSADVVFVAQVEASRILGRAGIRVRWIDCPDPGFQQNRAKQPDPACGWSRDPLILRLLITTDGRNPGTDTALGWTQPFEEPAVRATVAYRSIEKCSIVITNARLLSYVIAHEIGHLLFRSKLHGERIMQKDWSRSDMHDMQQCLFSFTAEQARELRQGVGARTTSSSQR